MSRDYYLIKDGEEVVVSWGMYELDDAVRVARHAAERERGHRYTVCKIVEEYEFDSTCPSPTDMPT